MCFRGCATGAAAGSVRPRSLRSTVLGATLRSVRPRAASRRARGGDVAGCARARTREGPEEGFGGRARPGAEVTGRRAEAGWGNPRRAGGPTGPTPGQYARPELTGGAAGPAPRAGAASSGERAHGPAANQAHAATQPHSSQPGRATAYDRRRPAAGVRPVGHWIGRWIGRWRGGWVCGSLGGTRHGSGTVVQAGGHEWTGREGRAGRGRWCAGRTWAC